MNWKSWPYWVKGGTLLVIVTAMLFAVLWMWGGSIVHTPMAVFLFIPGFLILEVATGNDSSIFLAAAITFVLCFIVGASFGHLYGKVKNRKNPVG